MKKFFLLFLISVSIGSAIQAQSIPKPTCTTILSEAMFAEVDTTKSRGVADNYHTWENGKVLLVKFMPGGGKVLRDKIMLNAKEWEKYANITLKFVDDTTRFTNLRIKLGKGSGHNSAVGTEANFRSQTMQTINFDTLYFADIQYYLSKMVKKGIKPPYNINQISAEMQEEPNVWNTKELRRVVMHEFGHALGLLHEQSFPGAVNWKKTDSVYNYYEETQGWSRKMVDFNVFEVAEQFYTNSTSYDPKSIMHYSIEPWQTTDGYSLKDNYEMSFGDKMLIAALYPKDKVQSDLLVPKVEVTNFSKLKVTPSELRKGLVIEPVFDLKTNAKLGEVYFVARLATEDGYYVKTTNLYYSWGGTAAAYKKMTLLPNTKISYNRSKKNFELFIPYDQLPDTYGQKVVIEFTVILDDVVNKQMDKLMYFSSTNPLSLPNK